MDRNGSHGTSWAEQWDPADPLPVTTTKSTNTKKSGTNSTAKYKQKFGEGLVKTKAVASTGFKKAKQGASVGFHWIKDKYHKTTHKG